MVEDPAPRVRLEAVRACSFIPTAASAEVALKALNHPMDYYLRYVLDETMTALQTAWGPALSTSAAPGTGAEVARVSRAPAIRPGSPTCSNA